MVLDAFVYGRKEVQKQLRDSLLVSTEGVKIMGFDLWREQKKIFSLFLLAVLMREIMCTELVTIPKP